MTILVVEHLNQQTGEIIDYLPGPMQGSRRITNLADIDGLAVDSGNINVDGLAVQMCCSKDSASTIFT